MIDTNEGVFYLTKGDCLTSRAQACAIVIGCERGVIKSRFDGRIDVSPFPKEYSTREDTCIFVDVLRTGLPITKKFCEDHKINYKIVHS